MVRGTLELKTNNCRGGYMKKLIKDCTDNLKAGRRIQLEYNKKEDIIKMFIIKTKKYNTYELKKNK